MRIERISSILICCAGVAFAQDKVTVPLSNPSQPVMVKAHLISGQHYGNRRRQRGAGGRGTDGEPEGEGEG